MNLILICAGLLMLLNPCVWIWDVLPDFLGAALIILGMRKIIFLNEKTEEIYRKLWALGIFSVVKLFFSIILYDLQGMVRMLSSFVAGCVEIYLVLSLVTGIPSILDAIQLKYAEEGSVRNKTGMLSLSKFLFVYTIVRIVLGFSPELTELSSKGEYGSVITRTGYAPSESKWALYIVAAAVSTLLFAFAAFFTVKCFRKYNEDKKTQDKIVDAAEKKNRADLAEYYSKRWSTLRIPFVACAILSVYFYVDGVDFLPKMIVAVLLCVLTLICADGKFMRVLTVAANVLLAVASYLSQKQLSAFYSEYPKEESIMWNPQAYKDFFSVSVLLIIQAALLFSSFLLMTLAVEKRKLSHLEEIGNRESRAKSFKHRMIALRICVTLLFVAAVAYPILLVEFPQILAILFACGIITVVASFLTELDAI